MGDGLISRRHALGIGVAAAALTGCSTAQHAAAHRSTTAPATAAPPATTATSPGRTPTPARKAGHRTKPMSTGPAAQVVRGSGRRPQVALTFHGAGDLGIVRQVMAILAQHKAKVTVLAVGTWLAATPDAARMVLDHGHELGNHTWSHPDLSAFPAEPMLVQIERCRDRLDALTGSPGAFFRQSQGQYPTALELTEAGKAGYRRVLSYDVDSLDWSDPGPVAIRSACTAARAGSVVSMHLGHPGTVLALPAVLQDLADRGLAPVTASELLR